MTPVERHEHTAHGIGRRRRGRLPAFPVIAWALAAAVGASVAAASHPNKWWSDNLMGPDSSNFVDSRSDQQVERRPAGGGLVLSVRPHRRSTRSLSTT